MNRRINVILKSALAFVLAACMLCGCESDTDLLDEATTSDVTQADEEETVGNETGETAAEDTTETVLLENVLMSNGSSNTRYVFESRLGEYIETADIITVTFLDSLADVPSDAVDVSENEDGSVMLWTTENGDGYDMYIAADGIIEIVDGHILFWNYENAISISFNGCVSTAHAVDFSEMFSECNSLTEVDLGDFDTANVTDMSGMFRSCASLTSLDLSGFDTSNVTNMSCMFSGCSSLTSLDLSGFDTSNVTDLSSMFQNCTSLESLDLSGFDTGNVTDFGYIISGCPLLSSDVVGGFDTSNASILPDGTDADKLREFENAETAYGEGTYYIFASRDDYYTSTYDGSEQYFLSEHVIYFQDGELVFHLYEISDYGKGSCGVDPETGQQYGYDVQKCEFYLMTVEQVIAALEEDGFTIVTAQTEWRFDEYDY